MVCMGRLRARSHAVVGLERASALFGGDPSPVMYTRLRQLGSLGDLEFTASVSQFQVCCSEQGVGLASHSIRDSDHRARERK